MKKSKFQYGAFSLAMVALSLASGGATFERAFGGSLPEIDTDAQFTKKFTVDSPDQNFVIGSEALYRLNVIKWQPEIFLTSRGAESYGGPRWVVIYSKQGAPKNEARVLAFRKEGSAKLGVNPKYLLSTLEDENLRVVHKLKPEGLSLVDTATLTNLSSRPLKVSHHETWNLYFQRIMTPSIFSFTKPIPGLETARRFGDQIGMMKKVTPTEIGGKRAGFKINRFYPVAPNRKKLEEKNFYPAQIDVSFSSVDDVYDVLANWQNPGSDSYLQKEQVISLLDADELTGPVWAGKKDLTIAPGESVSLTSTLVMNLGKGVDPDPAMLAKAPSSDSEVTFAHNPYLDTSKWETLLAEIRLKIEHMKSLTTWDEISDKLITTQGAYYLNFLGLHTSLRDFVNAAVGLISTVPEVAKQNLEYCMSLQGASDSKLPYSWNGVMHVNEEAIIRSDLSVVLIWGVVEYMKSNPDWNWFFQADVPYYPAQSRKRPPHANGRSPYEHLKAAFYYFKNVVGTGPHGLPHCKGGDWSDALLTLAGPQSSPAHEFSNLFGESPMVAAQAYVVLNDFITLLSLAPSNTRDQTAQLIKDLKAYTGPLKPALRKVFLANSAQGHPFFPRAILRTHLNKELIALDDHIDLAGQVWALMIPTTATGEKLEILTQAERDEIMSQLVATNDTRLGLATVIPPEGASSYYFRLQSRPWSTISQWYTKALTDNGKLPEAWAYFWKTSLANHNEVFAQKNNFGTPRNELVSGYDGWNPVDGAAWYLPGLAMNLDRWNNSNHPGMFLWAAHALRQKTLGINPWAKLMPN